MNRDLNFRPRKHSLESHSDDEDDDVTFVHPGYTDWTEIYRAYEAFYLRHQGPPYYWCIEASLYRLNREVNLAIHYIEGDLRWDGEIEFILDRFKRFIRTNPHMQTADAVQRTLINRHYKTWFDMIVDD